MDAGGSEDGILRGTPWQPTVTRQVEGRRSEARVLKARGAYAHPMSGAGSIKDDGHDDEYLYECKDTPLNFTLKGKELKALHKRAARQGRIARYVVTFADLGITADIYITAGTVDLHEQATE